MRCHTHTGQSRRPRGPPRNRSCARDPVRLNTAGSPVHGKPACDGEELAVVRKRRLGHAHKVVAPCRQSRWHTESEAAVVRCHSRNDCYLKSTSKYSLSLFPRTRLLVATVDDAVFRAKASSVLHSNGSDAQTSKKVLKPSPESAWRGLQQPTCAPPWSRQEEIFHSVILTDEPAVASAASQIISNSCHHHRIRTHSNFYRYHSYTRIQVPTY